jgi:hypothetical protein
MNFTRRMGEISLRPEKRIERKGEVMPAKPSAEVSESKTIIDAYGTFVDRLRLSPMEVRDEAELPYPKQRIINALAAAWSLSGGLSYAPARVHGWLLLLAQFQPGVGEPIGDPAAETARRMTGGRETGERVDPLELGRQVAEQAIEQAWLTRGQKFRGRVEQERARLLGLLRS